jgi:hypothetical protein
MINQIAGQTPEALLRSIEKLYMDVTEPLDPYIALALTNLSTKLAETIYLMGYQDGQRISAPTCGFCQPGECMGRAL